MLDGLLVAFTLESMLAIAAGVFVGIIVGALPGFTATMGTALLLPFTFALSPEQGIAMLGGLYVAAMFADSIPAILVNTPGTPSAVATALDGYPLSQQGKAQYAIVTSGFANVIGTTFGAITFLILMEPLADAALTFGPPEFFWLGVFALTIIGSIAGNSLVKGIGGGLLGMLIGTIGLSTTGAAARYTFGVTGLVGGIDLVAALIGIFAMPQVLAMVRDMSDDFTVGKYIRHRGVGVAVSKEIFRHPINVIRSSAIGTFVGILPGAGPPIASLVAYNEAMRWSKDRRSFGKGNIQGVVASEAAANGAAAGSMIPTLALGIPGSGVAAIILGALLLQGLQPGPRLMSANPGLVYGFGFSLIAAGVITSVIGVASARYIARIVAIPIPYLAPVVLFLSITGSYAVRSNLTDVFMMLLLGISSYFLARIGFHPGPIGLGVILGPIVEPALVQSLALTRASSFAEVFFQRPISIGLIALSVVSAAWVVYSNRKEGGQVVDDLD